MRLVFLLLLMAFQPIFPAYHDPADPDIETFKTMAPNIFVSIVEQLETLKARLNLFNSIRNSSFITDLNNRYKNADADTKASIVADASLAKQLIKELTKLSESCKPTKEIVYRSTPETDKINLLTGNSFLQIVESNANNVSALFTNYPTFKPDNIVPFQSLKDMLQSIFDLPWLVSTHILRVKDSIAQYNKNIDERNTRYNDMRSRLISLENMRSTLKPLILSSDNFIETTFDTDNNEEKGQPQKFKYTYSDLSYTIEYEEPPSQPLPAREENSTLTEYVIEGDMHRCYDGTEGPNNITRRIKTFVLTKIHEQNQTESIADNNTENDADNQRIEFCANLFSLKFAEVFIDGFDKNLEISFSTDKDETIYKTSAPELELYFNNKASLSKIIGKVSGQTIQAEPIFGKINNISYISHFAITKMNAPDRSFDFIWDIPETGAHF